MSHSSDFAYEVKLLPLFHRGANQIAIKPSVQGEPFVILKQMRCIYSRTNRCYYLGNSKQNLDKIFNAFKNKAWINMDGLYEQQITEELNKEYRKSTKGPLELEAKAELEKFIEYMKSRRLSKSTIGTYSSMVHRFLFHFSTNTVNEINTDMVKSFLSQYMEEGLYSHSSQKQMVSAIKLFYAERLNCKIELDKLPKVQDRRLLPKVLAVNEVKNIIAQTNNLKHRTMLSLCYGCGLRISELLNLKLADINSERMVLEILNAKGYKDRIVPFSEGLLSLMRKYYREYKPRVYLFEGHRRGYPYSRSSANKFLKKSAKKAKIRRNVHMHMLRHSFATHMLENGIDTRYIQKMLGHKSSKTTEIYTFVSNERLENIPNLYDKLGVI